MSRTSTARKAVAEQVREAAHRIGFFYIVNHGIDPVHAENTFGQAKRFFAQPDEKKMEVCTDLVTEYFGYFPMAKVCFWKHETKNHF
jgi:isopenicillin N synthase-like dioxygenase